MAEANDFCLLQCVETGYGALSAPYSKGIDDISSEVRGPSRETKHSPFTDFTNEWRYTASPLYAFTHRGNLTFTTYSGADNSLARSGRKQATATEDFEFHISYL